MDAFQFIAPEGQRTPVLVEVPHAGLEIPPDVLEEVTAPRDGVLRDADIYVDRLYADAPKVGATLIAARMSRYVVDLNRADDDVDAQSVIGVGVSGGTHPRGVVWRMTTDGRTILRRPLTRTQLERRLDLYHRPYHLAVERALRELRDEFGFAILLAAHSMPSHGRVRRGGPSVRRADVVPGTRGRRTADPRAIDFVDAFFRGAGLSVRHDEPYRGGYSTGFYGRPDEGWHAIQIELNRALYVDQHTSEPLTEDFERLKALLTDFVRELGMLDLR